VDAAGKALTFDGSSWSDPVNIDGPNHLSSVSCPSVSFCVAVDEAGNAIAYDGNSWSDPVGIDTEVVDGLNSVSCSSASFCVAVGDDGQDCGRPEAAKRCQ
jgi:hypothetical protein